MWMPPPFASASGCSGNIQVAVGTGQDVDANVVELEHIGGAGKNDALITLIFSSSVVAVMDLATL